VIELVPLSAELAPAWDALVRGSPDGWVFGLAGWQRLVLGVAEWGLRDLSFAAVEQRRLLGVMPLQLDATGARAASSGFGGSGPIVAGELAPAHRERVRRALLRHGEERARAAGAREISFAVPTVTAAGLARRGVNPFLEEGYEDVSTHTQVIDLAPDEATLLAGLADDARRQIARARSQGYRAERGDWPKLLDDYYRVHVETYRRTGVAPHPRAYFAGIAREMAPAGHAVLLVGYAPDGRPVAFHNDARLGPGALYHTGCSETEHLASGVNYLLFWQAILDAKAEGRSHYESGEVFPGAASGKDHGLSVFKRKFGGETRRFLRATKRFEGSAGPAAPPGRRAALRRWLSATRELVRAATPRRRAPAHATPALPARPGEDATRAAYESGLQYRAETICAVPSPEDTSYAGRLLARKFDLLRRHAPRGLVIDLCCGAGGHLFALAGEIERGIGIDFSRPFLAAARAEAARRGATRLRFALGDARRLPVADAVADAVYSFSALYQVPDLAGVAGQVARVLRPGGVCVLDLGNARSLNALCLRHYPELPRAYLLPVPALRAACERRGLEIVEHRAFQILPLWAGRPRWLAPLLHPAWQRVLGARIGGRMLDEWISSLPGVRSLAFRHLLVCRRRA
jgi:SAM-dependent methyltransferase